MKTTSLKLITLLTLTFVCCQLLLNAQASRSVIAVADIDANEAYPGAAQRSLSEMARLEMERIAIYEVMDNYDIKFIAKRDDLNIGGCYSKLCLLEIGTALKVDKILTGSVVTVGENIYVTLKVLDIQSGTMEKTKSNEFLYLPGQVKNMIRITLNDLFGLANDEVLVTSVTKRNEIEDAIDGPYKIRLKTDGPRMGFTVFEGDLAERIKQSQDIGGFASKPIMFQFGYQFEKQYLNEGNFQALFEFIPMVTGLDQGLFIPSFTFMNGLRQNKTGWEFAFGPTLSIVKKSRGYYDPTSGAWTLANDSMPSGISTIHRLDSRGNAEFEPGFVFAVGKTIKSGRLNMPVNVYVIPNNKGMRFGVSVGFNARDRYVKR